MTVTERLQAVSLFVCDLAQRAGCSREAFTISEGLTYRELCVNWYASPAKFKKIGVYTLRIGHNGTVTVMDWSPSSGFLVLATDKTFSAD